MLRANYAIKDRARFLPGALSTIDSWYSPSFPPRKHAARPRKKRMNPARAEVTREKGVSFTNLFLSRGCERSITVYASMTCNLMAIYLASETYVSSFYYYHHHHHPWISLRNFLFIVSLSRISEKWIEDLLFLHEHKSYCSSNLCGERNRKEDIL